MGERVGALAVVKADFTGFRRTLDIVGSKELESFHSLSGQYSLYEDVDPLKQRLVALSAEIDSTLQGLVEGDGLTAKLAAVAQQVELLDNMLGQLFRYVTVADLRGASLTSGDLLQKLQGWVTTLRDWLAGVMRQLAALTGGA